MNIVLVGPIHRQKTYFSSRRKIPFLQGQAQQSWLEGFESLGHKVFVFRYSDNLIFPNRVTAIIKGKIEKLFPLWTGRLRRFVENNYVFSFRNYIKSIQFYLFVKQVKPKIIVLSGGTPCLLPFVIQRIKKEMHTKTVLFSGVNPLTASIKIERNLVQRGLIDIVVSNDRKYMTSWKKLGATNAFVLPIASVDPQIHKKVSLTEKENETYKCDVCFVGKLTPDRQEILSHLTHFNIKVWGDIPPGVTLDQRLQHVYQGHAFGEKMIKIFNAAKIVLNFQPQEMQNGGNMRTFEIPGCGAFQLVDKVDIGWFTDKKDIVLFEGDDDLKKKIHYYLTHKEKRKTIADNGYKKAQREFTYKKRFQRLLKRLYEK